MSTPTAVTDPVAAPGSPKRPRGLLGAVAGSTMEVFDFTIYNTFAPFFAAAFFVEPLDHFRDLLNIHTVHPARVTSLDAL